MATVAPAKKSTKKVPAAKKTAKAAAKAPRAKKDGLRKPQVRILKALAKANKPLTRGQIAEKAPVDVATCVEYLGSHDESVRKANDKKHFPSLLTLGYVRFGAVEEGPAAYEITAAGRKAFEKSAE